MLQETLRWFCLVTALTATSLAQDRTDTARVCPPMLDQLIRKVERNYAAYHLEVAPIEKERARYEAFKARLRAEARRTLDTDCIWLLREFTGWFEDGHLFVQEYPSYSKSELAEFRRTRRTLPLAAAKDYLRAAPADLDPLEGHWFTTGYDVAVVKNRGTRGFVGIVSVSRTPAWRSGDVVAEFQPAAGGRYRATLRAEDHSPRHYHAAIQKGLILHMPPHSWGRRSRVAPHQAGLLDPVDPRAPTFKVLDARSCLLSLPSMNPKYKAKLVALLARHRAAIAARDVLVVDIRGNEGGSAATHRVLAPFYFGEPRAGEPRPTPPRVVLSSPDTRAYYQAVMKRYWLKPSWLRSLTKRLAANDGKFVPLFEKADARREFVPKRTHARPSRIGILVDEHVASAGEAFLLHARQFAKVTVFGKPTSGTIDYQNVQIVAFGRDRHRFGLGYPLIAASANLPRGGVNKTGIAPDVAMPGAVGDPIEFVRGALTARAK